MHYRRQYDKTYRASAYDSNIFKFHEIPYCGYFKMAPDGPKDGRTDGHGQNNIPPPSAGDKKKTTIFHAYKQPTIICKMSCCPL